MAAAARQAYCTLLTSDAYLPGAMVLAHSLRDCGTKEQLAVLVTLDSLQESTITELKKVYGQIIPVDPIINKAPTNLYLMGRPDLISTFTKIQLWKQTQYEHLVYIDADVVALRAPDELFRNNPPTLAAVPDIGWPDCFNSGVLSLTPNMGDYYALLALASRGTSFDGADQGLLNMHFGPGDWQRLSFTYNCTPSGNYQYVPAYRHFQSGIKMVHYIGAEKPWMVGRVEGKGLATGVYEELVGRWWAVYDKHYRAEGSQGTGQGLKGSKTVQQYVAGEMKDMTYGFSSDPTGALEKGKAKSSASDYLAEWDAQHQPPPAHSRPEAANFPHEVYNMSADPSLFRAPQNPQPPKGMYYEVPTTAPVQKLPPIFPWEEHQTKASRVFPEDLPPKPAPSLYSTTPSITTDSSNDDASSTTSGPSTPTAANNNVSSSTFSRTNAWDDIPEITRYISNLPQNRRAKVQVLINHNNNYQNPTPPSPSGSRTPTTTSTSTANLPPSSDPSASTKLTDFPTSVERPSLSVTPAPIPLRRPSFWSAERDAQGDLPPAEGVPHQNDWNPGERLTELARRQSRVMEEGSILTGGMGRVIPERKMLESSKSREGEGGVGGRRKGEDEDEGGKETAPEPSASTSSGVTGSAPGVAPAPEFEALNFAGGGGTGREGTGGGGGRGERDDDAVAPEEQVGVTR